MSDPRVAILDVRGEAAFREAHVPGAANIPLEELAARLHELPAKGAPLAVYDADGARAERAVGELAARGYAPEVLPPGAAALSEAGPARIFLWRPSAFLVEAVQTIGKVQAADAMLPPGRALDVACGAGREAVWLAMHGWQVDAVDVLNDALERAGGLAGRCGVSISAFRRDLRRRGELPGGAYDLVTVFRFLHRPVLKAIAAAVRPGGLLVYETFHRSDARVDHDRLPPRGAVLDGELAATFADFEPLIARNGVARQGRVFSQFLGRRRPARSGG